MSTPFAVILLVTINFARIYCQSASCHRHQYLDLFNWDKYPEILKIQNASITPDISSILQEIEEDLPKDDFYFGMNPTHMDVVFKLKEILLNQITAEDALVMAAKLRDRPEVNPLAWVNAVIGASTARKDMQGFGMVQLPQIIPDRFFPILSDDMGDNENDNCHAKVDESVGADNGEENNLWYFREDVTINSNHWYWHLFYPFRDPAGKFDRRGELFYFYHHQILARYHAERLVNGMEPVAPYDIYPESIIEQSYDPHLTEINSGKLWTPRLANRKVSNVNSELNKPGRILSVDLQERIQNIYRIKAAIFQGRFRAENGSRVDLNNNQGIDYIGNVVEANSDSINGDRYGKRGVHNEGHLVIGLVEDPKKEFDLGPGVMVDVATATRDPEFYTHHKFIDGLFSYHKSLLDSYELFEGDDPLHVKGISVEKISIKVLGDYPENELRTFWDMKRFDLSKGLDFNLSSGYEPFYVCQKHLNHLEFDYEIEVTVDHSQDFSGRAAFRIFLAPSIDQDGNEYNLTTIRENMIVMDIFTHDFEGEDGEHTVSRRSSSTFLTIDHSQSLEQIGGEDAKEYPYCGCGWPHHMLVPKGTVKGYPFELFVIASDGMKDFAEEPTMPRPECKEAYIMCGLLNSEYPDVRPMGWPFERKNRLEEDAEARLENLGKELPNAAHQYITIYHDDTEPEDFK